MQLNKGVLYGVGVGPGDPELLTLKAVRILREADYIAVPDSGSGFHVALEIAGEYIGDKKLIKFSMPMSSDKELCSKNHDIAAETIGEILCDGKNVAFLTLGDPSIYSGYMYIHKRVVNMGYSAQMVSGVTSFCAAAAKLGISLCEGTQPLYIVPALHDDAEKILDTEGTKVIMKSGRSFLKIKNILEKKGLTDKASAIERCGMDGEKIITDINEQDEPLGYFTTTIVKGE